MKVVEAMGQLDTATRNPRMRFSTHLDFCVLGDRRTGLVEPPLIGKDSARANQRLGACPRLGKAAFDE